MLSFSPPLSLALPSVDMQAKNSNLLKLNTAIKFFPIKYMCSGCCPCALELKELCYTALHIFRCLRVYLTYDI